MRAVVTLLNSRSDPKESLEYRQWLLQIAVRTAEAGKEGGNFLGWGSVQVNDAERAMLAQITTILELPA